jgi:uncharacterized protein (DUF2267 family)
MPAPDSNGRSTSLAAFVATVREQGALASLDEADHAARATLGELGGCLSWGAAENLAGHLPRAMRQLVRGRSFDSSMSRFAPRVFLQGIAAQVGMSRAPRDARAVLRTLDAILPATLREQLHTELASVWGPLTAGDVPSPPAVASPHPSVPG